jgi:hypothetical protein
MAITVLRAARRMVRRHRCEHAYVAHVKADGRISRHEVCYLCGARRLS